MYIELTVRLKDQPELGIAKIHSFYYNIEKGVKLDRELGGFMSWNLDNLEIVHQERREKV